VTLADLLQRAESTLPEARNVASIDHQSMLEQEVSEISYDSRRVVPGAVFVAIRGQRIDGISFIQEARNRGAVSVISESNCPEDFSLPWLVVKDARCAMAVFSHELYDHPSEEMSVVGITGTNGKTTTAYLVESIFEAAGISCGRLGTVSYRVGPNEHQASITTPESPDLQRLFREMVKHGCQASVIEASSHALTLRRVNCVNFSAAVFTNLTRDHLDFHGDMESYFSAKRCLFEMLPPDGISVINLDDPRGSSLLEIAKTPITYAMSKSADVTSGTVQASTKKQSFDVRTPKGWLHIESQLIGQLNVRNILAAISTCVAFDVPLLAIEKGISDLTRVPGRFEVVSDFNEDVTVVVDYAHTDDALKNLLGAIRSLTKNRLITVFGCGGDRDRSKRPLMGLVASRLSDLVIVTSDNPRSESPEGIIEDILQGITMPNHRGPTGSVSESSTPYLSIVDRREAIESAIDQALPGDVVVIAGKGHEVYQEVKERKISFDDAEIARTSLACRRDRCRVL